MILAVPGATPDLCWMIVAVDTHHDLPITVAFNNDVLPTFGCGTGLDPCSQSYVSFNLQDIRVTNINSSEFAREFKRITFARGRICAPEYPIIPNHAIIAIPGYIRHDGTAAFIERPVANRVWQLRQNQGRQ